MGARCSKDGSGAKKKAPLPSPPSVAQHQQDPIILQGLSEPTSPSSDLAPSPGLGATVSPLEPAPTEVTLEKAKPELPPPARVKSTCRILFGSQTGTAEGLARKLGMELSRRYSSTASIEVLDVQKYKAAECVSKEALIILVVATFGDGEPTDNAVGFHTWLVNEVAAVQSGAKEQQLKGVTYAVFGLGNTIYEDTFNRMGQQVFDMMGSLGAAPLLQRGIGDASGSTDEDFAKWCGELQAALAKREELLGPAPAEEQQQQAGAKQVGAAAVPAYEVHVASAGGIKVPVFRSGSGMSAKEPFLARVAEVRELQSPASDRSCVHVELDVSGSDITYLPGDHVGVYAQNSPAVIEELAQMLGTPSDSVISFAMPKDEAASAALAAPPFTGPAFLRLALGHFADALSSPPKSSLEALAAFAKDPEEAERLRRLASPEGKQEYATYISSVQRSLLEVLRDFPSARPTLGAFFGSVAPRLQPRLYSISSSLALHPRRVHITCAVVKDTTRTGRVHEGVASSWLQRCAVGATVPTFVRRSPFKLPADPATPIIMVGPGTGLAPFRGFLQERQFLQQSGTQLGPAVFFFGCRSQALDYIYREELEAWLQQGVLSDLHVAFSRDGVSKDYVQHHMEREVSRVWTLLSEQGAHLYVCGEAKRMARDVHQTLMSLVQAGRVCTDSEAEAFVNELQASGRYQRDVW